MAICMTMTRMRQRRLKLRWSQDYLASLAGVAQSDISKFETLRTLLYDCQAERLAKILGLKREELQRVVNRDEELGSQSKLTPAEV